MEITVPNKNAVNQALVQVRGNGNGDLSTDMGTRLDRVNDEVAIAPMGVLGMNLTASALVKNGAAVLVGYYLVSTGGGSVKFWNNTAGSGTPLMDTQTPTDLGFYAVGGDYGLAASIGIYCTITGTISIIAVYDDPTVQ